MEVGGGGGVKNGTLGASIFLSSGLEIVKSSSCQRRRWPWWLRRTKKILELLSFPVCVCVCVCVCV